MKLRTKIFIMVLGCVLAALIIQTCLFQNLSSKLIYEQAKEETLSTEDYLTYFYPFEKLDFHKKGTESGWSVADKDEIAVVMAMGNRCAFLLC